MPSNAEHAACCLPDIIASDLQCIWKYGITVKCCGQYSRVSVILV